MNDAGGEAYDQTRESNLEKYTLGCEAGAKEARAAYIKNDNIALKDIRRQLKLFNIVKHLDADTTRDMTLVECITEAEKLIEVVK